MDTNVAQVQKSHKSIFVMDDNIEKFLIEMFSLDQRHLYYLRLFA